MHYYCELCSAVGRILFPGSVSVSVPNEAQLNENLCVCRSRAAEEYYHVHIKSNIGSAALQSELNDGR